MAQAIKLMGPQVPRRRTYTAQWKENQTVEVPLPKDTVLVGLQIRLKGSAKYTFSGGAPAGRSEGAMDSLVEFIEVSTDRLGTIKNMRPHFLHMQQMLSMGTAGERLYSVGAASTDFPTTEGIFTFGTTGQVTSIDETVYLPFEQVFCEPGGFGREETYLNTRRATNVVLRLKCSSLSRLNVGTVTALAFDSSSAFDFEITTVERQDIPETAVFKVWKQIQKSEPFASAVNDKFIEINSENKLSGIMLYTADGSSTTQKVATNKLIKNMVLKKNGQENLQEISFQALQKANRMDYGVVAPWTGGASRFDGFAHLSQISRREIDSALDTSRAGGGVFSLHLAVSTNDGSVVTYTNGAELQIVTEEILEGR